MGSTRAVFPKDTGNCYRDSLKKQVKLLAMREREFDNGSSSRSVVAKWAVFDSRTELSLHALHSEDATQQQSQEYAGLHQHLTGLDQEAMQYLRDVRRISCC